MTNSSAVAGIVSAAFFAVPAIRQEIRRHQYAKFLKQNNLDKEMELFEAAEKFMIRNLLHWDLWDTIFLFLGLGCLALSFIIEIFSSP